ncbi:MAG: hypothetical protein K2P78_04505 [Gemmataceae bacterium]|nr:hypothetical protein [Gemmataceae bacterium]
MPEQTRLIKLASDANGGHFWLKCSQFAWTVNNQVAVVSFVGPQTAVKSLAAALNQNSPLTMKVYGGSTDQGRRISEYDTFTRLGNQGSYRCTMHRLPYNTVHCTALTKAPGFLPCVTEEAVWHVLQSARYTTPVMREWIPWLMREMEEQDQIIRLPAFQCAPGMLSIDSDSLDELVSRGLKSGALVIPERKEAA